MDRTRDYLIGMDCGTTNIKAVMMDDSGEIAAVASRPSSFISIGTNGREQDANEWWENAADIFRELTEIAGAEATANIRGICVSSHTVSLLPVDAAGVPLCNAITYQDSRSAYELEEIVGKIGFDRFVQIVGGQPSTAFLPNKLLWFKRNKPEVFARTAYFLQASSYINFKLTGEMTSDMDQALRTQCMDFKTFEWSEEIGAAIGVDLNRMLPRAVPIDTIIGHVNKEASLRTGLPEGIPVLAGCCDATASMYATGLVECGEAGESSGTTSLVFVGSMVQSPTDIPIVTRPCVLEKMPWVFDAPIQATGAAIKWYIDTLGAEARQAALACGKDIYTYLNELALEAPAGAGGLFFFPYLSGERAPLWNDHARGMFIGLSINTSQADLIRSVFEGTAYALRHVLETVRAYGGEAKKLRICGGGAKSLTWCRIKAAVLGMPIYLLDESAGDVPVGDALIAGNKLGVFPDLTEAVEKIIRVSRVIEPDPAWTAAYDKLYPYYIQMYQHLDKDLMNLRNTMKTLAD